LIKYYEIIQDAIEFIEKHITDPISVTDVAKNSFQSRWHFQRIFRQLTNYSVYTYIKKRRLALAGNELILSKDKIIDIALKYQYSTPESFLRAFKKEYDFNPLEYRKVPTHKVFQKIRVAPIQVISQIKEIKMQEITRNKILFIGLKNRTTMQRKQNEIDIPKFWNDFSFSNSIADIPNKVNSSSMGIYCNWDIDENFDILTGAEVSSIKEIPNGFTSYEMPAMRYMVFTAVGNSNAEILAAWNFIYGVWMPQTGYERGFSDDFDLFDDRFLHPTNPTSEIYIPLH
jgi:AraC family transcriptional regulator